MESISEISSVSTETLSVFWRLQMSRFKHKAATETPQLEINAKNPVEPECGLWPVSFRSQLRLLIQRRVVYSVFCLQSSQSWTFKLNVLKCFRHEYKEPVCGLLKVKHVEMISSFHTNIRTCAVWIHLYTLVPFLQWRVQSYRLCVSVGRQQIVSVSAGVTWLWTWILPALRVVSVKHWWTCYSVLQTTVSCDSYLRRHGGRHGWRRQRALQITETQL